MKRKERVAAATELAKLVVALQSADGTGHPYPGELTGTIEKAEAILADAGD
jgi:hypothetical protein